MIGGCFVVTGTAIVSSTICVWKVIRETQLAIAPLKKNSVRKGLATLELGVAALEQSLTTYVRDTKLF